MGHHNTNIGGDVFLRREGGEGWGDRDSLLGVNEEGGGCGGGGVSQWGWSIRLGTEVDRRKMGSLLVAPHVKYSSDDLSFATI